MITGRKKARASRRSPSSRRAWIEIWLSPKPTARVRVALLAEGVDRNRYMWSGMMQGKRSPSSRRAWIEIRRILQAVPACSVALLAEGVDRNHVFTLVTPRACVALLAEGVDRNFEALGEHTAVVRSPSSRRAWIEMGELVHRLAARRGHGRPPRGGRG